MTTVVTPLFEYVVSEIQDRLEDGGESLPAKPLIAALYATNLRISIALRFFFLVIEYMFMQILTEWSFFISQLKTRDVATKINLIIYCAILS